MRNFHYILGIDTSCDETSAAVIEDGNKILSNMISSQLALHQPHGGVVPELASRAHTEALPWVVEKALQEAGIDFSKLSGIAVTTSPGLIGCLLVGLSYAKSLAYSLNIPLTAVHHLKAHLFSPFLQHPLSYPFLGLVVSGGHTALYTVEDFSKIRCLGQTVDDAAGEAFDKVAKLMGLGYPGGPVIDKLARQGNPERFKFTRARVKKGPTYWSFSGLKTAVRQLIGTGFKTPPPEAERRVAEGGGPPPRAEVLSTVGEDEDRPCQTVIERGFDPRLADLCASFQEEVVQSLIEKVELALEEYPVKTLAVSGGVAVNSRLRTACETLSKELKIHLAIPSPLLCTDNGAMVAFVGSRQLAAGLTMPLEGNAHASAPLW